MKSLNIIRQNKTWSRDHGNGCVCVSKFSVGVLSSVLSTRAGTKKEHTPPLSQVSSIMTGKVIDYTPH